PREILGVPAQISKPTGTTSTTPTTPATSQVTAAPAASMVQLEQKYGFNAPSGKSDKDFAKYAQNFTKERDLAAKFAPKFNIDPEMVVWWTWFETAPPYDSYSYNNCHDALVAPDTNCGTPGSGQWQIGYGEQMAPLLSGSTLQEAFVA